MGRNSDVGRARYVLSLAPFMKEYIDKESNKCGMNASSFITMCVNQYKIQSEGMDTMSKLLQELELKKLGG